MASPPNVNREDTWPLETPGAGTAQGVTEKDIQARNSSDEDRVKSPKVASGKETSSLGKIPGGA